MDDEQRLSVGDVVIDLVDDWNTPLGEPPDRMIVLRVRPDERADEYEIDALEGMTLAEAAYDWPIHEPDGYDADADHPVEVVYIESLERVIGGAYRTMDYDTLRSNVENNPRLTSYSYHSQRLEPAPWSEDDGTDDGSVAGP